MKPVLLFDIDGTLMHVKHAFTRKLIASVLDEYGIDSNSLDDTSYSFAGRTDKEIFMKLLSAKENGSHLYEDVKQSYLKYMNQHFSSSDTEAIEGAMEFVKFAKGKQYPIGLCTGNFRESAFNKVEAAGFVNTFSFGGFGCNHADRKYLPGEAIDDYKKIAGKEPDSKSVVVIGDTPNDIRCAKFFGAVSVAVTTGSYSESELRSTSPDLLISDLRELIDRLPTFF